MMMASILSILFVFLTFVAKKQHFQKALGRLLLLTFENEPQACLTLPFCVKMKLFISYIEHFKSFIISVIAVSRVFFDFNIPNGPLTLVLCILYISSH